jgi:hypothetical protein
MNNLDNEDKRILGIIKKKPLKYYQLKTFIPILKRSATLGESEQLWDGYKQRLDRLVNLGLIEEHTFYRLPKTKS